MTRKLGNHRGKHCRTWPAAILLMLLLSGCKAQKQPVYEDGQGFRFVPPPGWVERVRDDALPSRTGRRQQNIPLPPVDISGQAHERFLVRYDRITTGQHAWLRATVADLPSYVPLAPARDWKRESEEKNLEVSGLPASRIAYVGRWQGQDYLCETFIVRKGEKVYLFSAAFPAADQTARTQVRQAINEASWR